MAIKQIIGLCFAVMSFIWDLVLSILLIVHKVKHTNPAEKKAKKQARQLASDTKHLKKLNARIEKIEKKYKIIVDTKNEVKK